MEKCQKYVKDHRIIPLSFVCSSMSCFLIFLFLCLQLELQSTGPSTPSVIMDEEGNIIDSRDASREPIQFVFEDIHWTSELSRQEATRRLDVTFYPFKRVNVNEAFIQHAVALWQPLHCSPCAPSQVSYLPFSEAFERAEAENKLVHSILLWGALDDQSCWGKIIDQSLACCYWELREDLKHKARNWLHPKNGIKTGLCKRVWKKTV